MLFAEFFGIITAGNEQKDKQMATIPNTEYITVKRDRAGKIDIFVGGKPTTIYHGCQMENPEHLKNRFEDMQKLNPEVEEYHIGAFDSFGKFTQAGNPSGKIGQYVWCRVKLKGVPVSSNWVCLEDMSRTILSSLDDYASKCTLFAERGISGDNITNRIYRSADFRSALFAAATQDTNRNTKNDKSNDLNKYRIMIERNQKQ